MKKHRKAKQFLEELKRVPVVSSICDKLGISRNTIYRWRKEDAEFKKLMDESQGLGKESISDLAESKLIQHIQKGEPRAVEYWLSNNKYNYMRPRPKDFWEQLSANKFGCIKIELANDSGKKRSIDNTITFVDFSDKEKEDDNDVPIGS